MSQHHPARASLRRRLLPSRPALALTVGALTLLASACGSSDDEPTSTASSPDYDTAAVAAGAGWLQTQVTDGVVHNDQYDIDDYGLSVDVALSLDAVGEQTDTVDEIGDQVAEHVKEYTAPGYGTLVSAGSTAKAVVLAQAVGADPASYGGTDLVAQLEGTVADDGPAQGRIQDTLDKKEAKAVDYANVIGQAYAVTALDAAGSNEAAAATDFLLAQQCSAGWFRLTFTKDAGADDQSCDGDSASAPDIDATAFAVRALSAQSDDAAIADQVDAAVAWLAKQQSSDGSFSGGKAIPANSNSTGLVGWVLAEAGETDAAERAASWVADHQVCGDQAGPDAGAIAYDDPALAAAEKGGITDKTSDQFRRATAQALPALQWLPADAGGTC